MYSELCNAISVGDTATLQLTVAEKRTAALSVDKITKPVKHPRKYHALIAKATMPQIAKSAQNGKKKKNTKWR